MAELRHVRWKGGASEVVRSRRCSVEEAQRLAAGHRLFYIGAMAHDLNYRRQAEERTVDDVVLEVSSSEAEQLLQTLSRSGHFLIENASPAEAFPALDHP